MRSQRIACPAHGGGDSNCSLWRDSHGRLRAKCWSHGCPEGEILRAVGEMPANSMPPTSFDPEHSRTIALRLWNESRDARGTLALNYLKRRGITVLPPASLHYHPALRHPNGFCLPGLVAAVEDHRGRFIGVHRTWLTPDGSDKAAVTPQKAALGSISGGAIRLTAKLSDTLALCEGIEDGLSILEATGLAVWVTPSTSGLRSVQLPDCVRTVIIAADNDRPGQEAARAAAMRFHSEGRTVRVASPSTGKDFNDLLRTPL